VESSRGIEKLGIITFDPTCQPLNGELQKDPVEESKTDDTEEESKPEDIEEEQGEGDKEDGENPVEEDPIEVVD